MKRQSNHVILIVAAMGLIILCLGTKCDLPIPGLKPKGKLVTKINGLETMTVRTKEESGLTLAEFSTVRLLGFNAPPHTDPDSRLKLRRKLEETLQGKLVNLEYDEPDHPWLSARETR